MVEPIAPQVKRPRPSRLITALYLLPFALLLLIANIAEEHHLEIPTSGKYGPHFENDLATTQGWPKKFLSREPVELKQPPFWRHSPWRLWEGVVDFDWQAAIIDVGLALGLLGLGGAALESIRGRLTATSGWHFSLMDLLLATTVVALFCGLYAWQRHRYEQQVAILKQIESVTEYPSSVDWYSGHILFFDRARALFINGDEIQHAIKLDTVKVLHVHGVTNAQLSQLSQMKSLEALDLMMEVPADEPTGEHDRAFQLPPLPKLRGLNLFDAAFRGDGLENVPALEQLDASGTQLDDSDVEALSKLTRLKRLSLGGTEISDAGVAKLRAALPDCQIDPP